MSDHSLSRGTVEIVLEACKGCELCLEACPPRVLSMSNEVNLLGYRYPLLHPGCTGCAACVLVCPDFCISAWRFENPKPAETGA